MKTELYFDRINKMHSCGLFLNARSPGSINRFAKLTYKEVLNLTAEDSKLDKKLKKLDDRLSQLSQKTEQGTIIGENILNLYSDSNYPSWGEHYDNHFAINQETSMHPALKYLLLILDKMFLLEVDEPENSHIGTIKENIIAILNQALKLVLASGDISMKNFTQYLESLFTRNQLVERNDMELYDFMSQGGHASLYRESRRLLRSRAEFMLRGNCDSRKLVKHPLKIIESVEALKFIDRNKVSTGS